MSSLATPSNKVWYNEDMVKQKKTKKGRKTRRPTKAELAQQEKIKSLTLRFLVMVILFFAATKLGVFGLTVYNLFRLLVGSTAYMLIIALLIYVFFSNRLKQKKGIVSGFCLVFSGILLEYQAYFDIRYQGSELLAHTARLAISELSSFKVTSFLGGGLMGGSLYVPISFLFATIGTLFIGAIMIVFGLFLMSPWTIYDVADTFSSLREKYHVYAQERAEKQAQKQAKKAAKKEDIQVKLDDEPINGRDLSKIDLETGEILEEDTSILPPISQHSQEEEEFPVLLAEDDIEGEVIIKPSSKSTLSSTYMLPSIDLFSPIKVKSQANEKKLVRQNIKVLEETFASFGIKVAVERAEIGPSVTKYEVKPAVGVRVNRISNLADDLALALAAKDVRIEAPIPGKSLVGIEVPNSEVAMVPFRELWEQAKTSPDRLLDIPLGKAVNGTVRSFDLARMPHLLVAGSTGSGKSVAVNGIIASILMKAGPDQVKFLMIDPKMVELSVYNEIPHLLIPVVTNPRKAAKALQKVVDEMEKRYELFSHLGVRNLEGYNTKVADYNQHSDEKQIPLPLIVVIVDELADLMMVASKEVEDAIIRLGQKARAAGIHMILATQRPSVDVISGLIKANVPSRIAFAVSSGTDSRTILDENGAEKLLGRGDMLFKPIDENHPVRLQGSFISDSDVEAIVSFIKAQAEADYDETFDPGEVAEGDIEDEADDTAGDPLFDQAKALVIETQKASASMLQRRLSVGFNRATRLMEELEMAGVIGPAEGTKPRKVLETAR